LPETMLSQNLDCFEQNKDTQPGCVSMFQWAPQCFANQKWKFWEKKRGKHIIQMMIIPSYS